MKWRTLGLIVLSGVLWAVQGWAGTCPFRSTGSQLEYFDPYTSMWERARVNPSTGDIDLYSDGTWWPTYNPATGYPYTASDLSCLGGKSSTCPEKLYRQQSGWRHATRNGRDVAADVQTLHKYTLQQNRWSDEGDSLYGDSDYGESGCLNETILDIGGSSLAPPKDVAPAQIPEWRVYWDLSSSYIHDDFDVLAGAPGLAKTHTLSQSVSMTAIHDRVGIVTSLTYDWIDPDDGFGDTAYDRIGFRLTPIWTLLEQVTDGFNLDLITSVGASHSWYDEDITIDDPSRIYGTVGLGIGRFFSFGGLSLSYLYGVSRNISGDDEITDKATIPVHTTSLTYTAPLARKWLVSLGIDWQHTNDMPSDYDSNEYFGRGAVSYSGTRWGASADVERSISSGNQREWALTGRVSYHW